MDWFSTWTFWYWLVFGFILLIAESIIPGIFLLWWGVAALVVAGLNSVLAIPLAWNWIIFATLAVIASLIWWRYQHTKDQKPIRIPHLISVELRCWSNKVRLLRFKRIISGARTSAIQLGALKDIIYTSAMW